MKSKVLVAALVVAAFSVLVSSATNITAQSAEDTVTCTPVKSIFARGSGQSLNEGEYTRFRTQLQSQLPDPLASYYELGSEAHGGSSYPAVNVSDLLRNGNAIGAAVSGGLGNDYGRSVNSGVLELKSYLESTHSTCPSTLFILGGYSQGAQVIGQSLPSLSTEIRSKIVFSGLFGDPKLNLPEGRGFFPPACRGENLSLYRREIANCNVDQGSLGYRDPYLPSGLESKTGLWCYPNDFVCGSSKNPLNTSGHGQYGREGMAIDKAVDEAVSRLRTVLPEETASSIPAEDTENVDDSADVVYVIDTSSSMSNQIASAKQFAAASASNIMAKNGRVALVAYKDAGYSYTAQVMSGFSSDPQQFQSALDLLSVSGGGDAPEALLHALMTAFNGLDWKYGATKAAVVLTDAGFHNPDKVDGSTLADVVQRSLEIDPVNIYAVIPNYYSRQYEELASQTSGQVIINSGDTVVALNTALSKIQTRPVITLPLAEYKAEVGQSIAFNTSVSVPEGASITSYDWDLDGDGTFDETTTAPTLLHAYNSVFDGFMQVRANASNDTVASASAKIEIGVVETETVPESPTNLSISILSTTDSKSTVKLSWSLPANLPDHYVLTLNGIGLGTLTPERTSVEIRDIDRTITNEVGLVGAAADGTEGEINTVVVEKEQPPTEENEEPSLVQILKQFFEKVVSTFFWWVPQQ